MRCLERNKSVFYYALFNGKEEIRDENGLLTGDYRLKYGKPIKVKANVSGARGETRMRQFGEDVPYDKVILLEKPDLSIDEYAILWVDKMPVLDRTGATVTPHDYVVKQVARSINAMSLAIAKVDVQ